MIGVTVASARERAGPARKGLFFFFITLGLELSDTKVCEP